MTGFAEDAAPFPVPSRSTKHMSLKIDSAGRLVIPAEMRAAMGARPGDTVTAEVVDGELRIVSPVVALERVRAFARAFRKKHPDARVVDEFLQERREEAARE